MKEYKELFMGGVININTVEQLMQFLNENGLMEVVIRNKNKRFINFQKISLSGLMQNGYVIKKSLIIFLMQLIKII